MYNKIMTWIFGKKEEQTIPFQIDGIVVGRLYVTDKQVNELNGKNVKFVVVPNRIINIVSE